MPISSPSRRTLALPSVPGHVTNSSSSTKEEADRLSALMTAYARGDTTAFSPLFALVAPRLHGYFRRSFGASAVAEDLLQTTFLKLHHGRHRYDETREAWPWIYSVAARVRADELRRRYRLPPHDRDEALDAARVEPDIEPACAMERVDRVRAALNALPEGQRAVVLLHRFEGLSFREVGEALDLAEGTVRVRACRAYATLRAQLAELVEEDA